ncbi:MULTISPECIES: response regulator [unclassified Paenibacillus]|uniref:response regulator n=1 Tax=unclassified Paenibacillus TaxID=185978 RepID=UPI0008CFAAD1|nr:MULTISPECIES: response regulator [unclassified Paenibacillus]QLG38071.1 response regulator [Paenibacillus sp. E222]SEO61582.1 two-component system, response regulator YesN [Paenibacillus sp. OK076]
MLRAVVCDDESIVIQGLQGMIDWTRYGIELVGTAGDGLSALHIVQELQPDIILTDIRMPGLNGLELIEKLTAIHPDIACIVFSGFNEFDYVRRAIHLGVIDYLEKPITIEHVEQALVKTVDRLQRHQTLVTLQSQWSTGKQELLEKATMDLMVLGIEAIPKWKELFGPEADQITEIRAVALSSPLSPSEPNCPGYQCIHTGTGGDYLLAMFPVMPAVEGDVSVTINEIHSTLSPLSDHSPLVIGLGNVYSLHQAQQSYQEARKALRHAQFTGQPWVAYSDMVQMEQSVMDVMTQHRNDLELCLRTRDRRGLLIALKQFQAWSKTSKIGPEPLEKESLRLIYTALDAVRKQGVDPVALSPVLEQIHGLHTRDAMFDWLREQLDLVFQAISTEPNVTSRHPAILKALSYMNEHYSSDISLQEVAQYAELNPTYFSLLFKEQTGTSYIKYLTHMRIDLAKSMLSQGLRVHETGTRVGYPNYRHFTDTFKKITGITPGQYRSSCEEDRSHQEREK